MPYITIDKMSFNYETFGCGEPLILIGGLTANCREWLRMRERLGAHFTVYTLDNRGTGQTTGWSSDLSIAEMADDIAILIETLRLKTAYVVGHSMGGAIVQHLCIHHPNRVKAAIMASSFAHFPKASQLYIESSSALLAAGVSLELVLRTIYTRLYASEFLSDETNINVELQRMLRDPSPQTPEGYEAQVRAIREFDARGDLSKIQCPTLIINGVEDILTPVYLSEELHQNIYHSRLHLVPQCGHMIPHEKPAYFSQCIIDFFNEWRKQ